MKPRTPGYMEQAAEREAKTERRFRNYEEHLNKLMADNKRLRSALSDALSFIRGNEHSFNMKDIEEEAELALKEEQ